MAHRRILLEDEPICSSKSENKLIELSAAPSPEPALKSVVIGSGPSGPGGWVQPPWATPNVVAQVTSIPPFRPPQTNVTVTVTSPQFGRRYGAAQIPSAPPPNNGWDLLDGQSTFQDLLGIPDSIISCNKCGYNGAFDGNVINQTIQCLGCGHMWSFVAFKEEYGPGSSR